MTIHQPRHYTIMNKNNYGHGHEHKHYRTGRVNTTLLILGNSRCFFISLFPVSSISVFQAL